MSEGPPIAASVAGGSGAWRPRLVMRAGPRERVLTAALLGPALAYLVAFFGYPLLVTFATSLTPAGASGPSVAEYARILSSSGDWGVLALTLGLAAGTTLLSIALAVPLALALRARPRGHQLVRVLVLAPLMVLALVSALGLLIIWDRTGWLNLLFSHLLPFAGGPLAVDYTVPGLLLFYTWLFAPYTILTTFSAIEGIDPNIEEAARVSGATPGHVLRSVTLPLAWPGIRSGSILTFLLAFGAFSVPLIAGGDYRPLAVVIYTEATVFQDWARGSALAMVMALVAVVAIAAYMFTSRGSGGRRG